MSGSLDLDAADRQPTPHAQTKAGEAGTRPYDPAEAREWVRGLIAAVMTVLFCGVIVALAAEALRGKDFDYLTKLSAIILTPVSGLLGAVVGFYYGEHSRH